MRVSLVVTVLNEAGSLPWLLDSLAAQTRAPDEVIVCDGGSTDGTLEVLEAEDRVVLRVIQRPGTNISQGRNAAIESATGEVIAVTDAGVRLSPGWLERIVAPFEDPATQAVSGFFRPDPRSVFEVALGATVLPEVQEFDLQRFLPSSRSFAFRKSAWAAAGGYPEWLDYCEDLVFDLRLRDRCGPIAFVPDAVVHFRPRRSLHAFFVQYYRYARGDGKADLWRSVHAARYVAYLGGLGLLVAGMLLRHRLLSLLALSLLLGVVALRSTSAYRRLVRTWRDLKPVERLQAALWVVVIRVMGDVAKMIGYPAGLWWRRRHRGRVPDWRRA